MLFSSSNRYSQNPNRTFQDTLESRAPPDWRSDQDSSLDRKQLFQSTMVPNNSYSNNNSSNFTNDYAYQAPSTDHTFSGNKTANKTYDQTSPLSTSMNIPSTSFQPSTFNSNQYQFSTMMNNNTPNQASTFSGNNFFNNAIDSVLPQLNMSQTFGAPLQPLLMPQPSQLDYRPNVGNSSDSPMYRTSSARSNTKYGSKSESKTTELTSKSEGDSIVRKKSKRSRLGCLTCRHRKKRCCETKPRCTECSRLGLNCTWPIPGTERKNRSKNNRISHDEMYHSIYGPIKILRGVVEYKSND